MTSAADALMRDVEFAAAYHEVSIPERLLGLLALRQVLTAAERSGTRGADPALRDALAALQPRAPELVGVKVPELRWEFHSRLARLVTGFRTERQLAFDDLEACLAELERKHRDLLRPKAYALLDRLREARPDHRTDHERWLRERLAQLPQGMLSPLSTELKQFFEQEWAELEGIAPQGQSAVEFFLLRNYKRSLDFIVAHDHGKDGSFRTSSRVFFGTLGRPTPYAEIRSVPDSDQLLIVLSRGLWLATGFASLLAARSVQLEDRLFPIRIELAPATSLADLGLTLRALLAGEREEAPYPPLEDPARASYWESLDFAMKGFVFAHEYAHFLHGHFDDTASARVAGPPRNPWAREYEADALALHLLVADVARHSREHIERLWGAAPIPIEIVATLPAIYAVTGATLTLDLIDEMEHERGTFARLDDAHPPALLRIRRLWNIAARFPSARAVAHAVTVARQACAMLLEMHAPATPRSWVRKVHAAAFGGLWKLPHAKLEAMLQHISNCLRTGSEYEPSRSDLESQLWSRLSAARADFGPDLAAAQCDECAAMVRRDGGI